MSKHKDWILWTVVCVFMVAAIGGMWAIDFIYSPEMNNATVLPEAAGK